jgi:hypothetical protein
LGKSRFGSAIGRLFNLVRTGRGIFDLGLVFDLCVLASRHTLGRSQ